jgi:hypothetical protein
VRFSFKKQKKTQIIENGNDLGGNTAITST